MVQYFSCDLQWLVDENRIVFKYASHAHMLYVSRHEGQYWWLVDLVQDRLDI